MASLAYDVNIPAKHTKTINLIIAGSYHSTEAARETYRLISEKKLQFFEEKRDRYKQLAQQSKINYSR